MKYASDGSTMTAEPAPADESPAEETDIVDVETDPTDDVPPADPTPDPADVVDAEVVTDVAVTKDGPDGDTDEKWAHEPDWKYDELEYHGDTLAFRVPTQNALNALYQSAATCSDEFAMKMATKFVKHHLSEKTRERVLERMADPDDPEYSAVDGVWNDLLTRISNIGGQRVLKNAKALSAVKNGKGK